MLINKGIQDMRQSIQHVTGLTRLTIGLKNALSACAKYDEKNRVTIGPSVTGWRRHPGRRLRRFATPRKARDLVNPVAASPELTTRAMAHFADHCSSCHGNDGRGAT